MAHTGMRDAKENYPETLVIKSLLRGLLRLAFVCLHKSLHGKVLDVRVPVEDPSSAYIFDQEAAKAVAEEDDWSVTGLDSHIRYAAPMVTFPSNVDPFLCPWIWTPWWSLVESR